ncbi:hypothetical protein RQP46_008271 [Phenoliferia psychrophenolica]
MSETNAAPADAPLPRRASLLGLPTELKGRIVELAHLADERFRLHKGSEEEEAVNMAVAGNRWRGKSASALSETCKQFNELAAPFIFHTLQASKAGRPSSYFALAILPRHGLRFRILDLKTRKPDVSRLSKTLSFVLFLPNLDQIILGDLRRLLGSYRELEQTRLGELVPSLIDESQEEQERKAEAALARRTFIDRFRSIKNVILPENTRAKDAARLAKCFDSPRSLTTSFYSDTQEPAHALINHLASLPDLQNLAITSGEPVFSSIESLNPWQSTLSSLTLISVPFDRNTTTFIALHARTLRRLAIEYPEGNETYIGENTTTSLFQTSFPALYSLQLLCVGATLEHLLPILSSFATPKTSITSPLTHIDLFLESAFWNMDVAQTGQLISTLQAFSETAESIKVVNHDVEANRERPLQIALRASPLAPVLHPDCRSSPFLYRDGETSVEELGPEVAARRVEEHSAALRDTLMFALQHVDQLEKEADLKGMEELFHSLETLKGHQILRDD